MYRQKEREREREIYFPKQRGTTEGFFECQSGSPDWRSVIQSTWPAVAQDHRTPSCHSSRRHGSEPPGRTRTMLFRLVKCFLSANLVARHKL